jgi:hypothetical protein
MKFLEDKSLCISPVQTSGTYGLSRKGEFPVKSITLLVIATFFSDVLIAVIVFPAGTGLIQLIIDVQTFENELDGGGDNFRLFGFCYFLDGIC